MRKLISMLARKSTSSIVKFCLFSSGIRLGCAHEFYAILAFIEPLVSNFIFDKRRKRYSVIFYSFLRPRNSKKSVSKVCRGFFSSPGHLASHFTYLTSVPDLKETVGGNLKSQIGIDNLFKYPCFKTKLWRIPREVSSVRGQQPGV